LSAFNVGYDGIFSPHIAVNQGVGVGEVNALSSSGELQYVVINDQQFVDITEGYIVNHVIVRNGGSGKRDTRVARVEEGERNVQDISGERLVVSRDSGDGTRVGEFGNITNHIVVTVALVTRHSEGRPEIQEEGIHTFSDQVVEREVDFTDQVVTQVTSPTETTVSEVPTERDRRGVQRHARNLNTQPSAQKIITSTRNFVTPRLTETRVTTRNGQNSGSNGEPSGLANLLDEISYSSFTTIHILFRFIISSQIDESGC
jgi:hypothetical protein